jgi:DNA-binding beta-propeller fold protein YncE
MISLRSPGFVVFALLAGAVLAPAVPSFASGAPGDLYVTSDASNLVRSYDGASGFFNGVFCASSAGSGQMAIHFGATNGKVLIGHLGGGVEEHDATTGALLQTFAPGGGWQWAGIYAPNGNVYIGSQATNDVRIYDPVTAAFLGVLYSVQGPADMEFGPNGNLYICSYTTYTVHEVHPLTGAPISVWSLPFGERANDITFLNGEFLVTAMGTNKVWRYDAAHNLVGNFAGSGWMRPHGIAISPHDGNIYAVDGVTTQVHVFHPLTFVELNPAFLTPNPGDKIVDLAFRPEEATPAPPTSWGRVKASYRR